MRKEPSNGRSGPFVHPDNYVISCGDLAFRITAQQVKDGLLEDHASLGAVLYGLLVQVAKERQAKARRAAPVFGGTPPVGEGGDVPSDVVSKEEG